MLRIIQVKDLNVMLHLITTGATVLQLQTYKNQRKLHETSYFPVGNLVNVVYAKPDSCILSLLLWTVAYLVGPGRAIWAQFFRKSMAKNELFSNQGLIAKKCSTLSALSSSWMKSGRSSSTYTTKLVELSLKGLFFPFYTKKYISEPVIVHF